VITADDVLRLIGSMYRLASVAVDIEAEELAQLSLRISGRLGSRRRLWSRKKRPLVDTRANEVGPVRRLASSTATR
jgi:hypothetical protein